LTRLGRCGLLRETPQSITVVTADRVTDQGALTVQESLRYVPGVFADTYGPDSRGDYPRIRGQDPNTKAATMPASMSKPFPNIRPRMGKIPFHRARPAGRHSRRRRALYRRVLGRYRHPSHA
jgi:hypothetical protein